MIQPRWQPPSTPSTASYELHARATQVIAGGVSTAFRAFERPVPLSIVVGHGIAPGRRGRQRPARLRLRHGADHPRARPSRRRRRRHAGGGAAAAAERAVRGRGRARGAAARDRAELRAAAVRPVRLRGGARRAARQPRRHRPGARRQVRRPLPRLARPDLRRHLAPAARAARRPAGQLPSALADLVAIEWNDTAGLEAAVRRARRRDRGADHGGLPVQRRRDPRARPGSSSAAARSATRTAACSCSTR